MAERRLPTLEDFHVKFEYRDGVLYRKVRAGNAKAGSVAGSRSKVQWAPLGRWYINVGNGLKLLRSRIIYFMHYGVWPPTVDHINGNTVDDRIENLRAATFSENSMNTKVQDDTASSRLGVSPAKTKGKWRATIHVNKHQKYLGTFDSIEKAAAARKEADKIYGYHENHGRKL